MRPRKAISRLIAWAFLEGRPLTTRGRWINPLVFAGFRLFSLLPQLRTVKGPIFIVGTGRSGTTILGVVLSMHRDIMFLNEPKAIWNHVHPHEDLIGSYSRGPAWYRLAPAEATLERVRLLRRLYGACLFTGFSTRILDKYPEVIFRREFVRALCPDARFLFLYRNGVDACASIARWSARKGVKIGAAETNWWGWNDRKWRMLVDQILLEHADLAVYADEFAKTRDHQDRAAIEWIISMREGKAALDAGEDDILPIKYESLITDQDAILSGIVRFCGLNHDQAMIDYAKKTLKPVKSDRIVKIHPQLVKPFRNTMMSLGYKDENRIVSRK